MKQDKDRKKQGAAGSDVPFGRYYGALGRLTAGTDMAAGHRRMASGLVEEISARFHQIAADRAGENDLHATDLQVMLLLELGSPDHVLKATELQRALGFTPGGVTRRLDSMSARGLVERLPDPDDGRAWLVRLTDFGRETIKEPLARNVPRNKRIEQAFTASEWQSLIGLLRRLADVLGED